MKKRFLKKGIGILVMTALLCLGMIAVAMAAEMEFPEPQDVTQPRLVEVGSSATVSFPVGKNIAKYKLIVKDTNGWSTVKTATSTLQTGTVSFTIEGSLLEANHIYTVELAAYDNTDETAATTKGEIFSSRVLNVVPKNIQSGFVFFSNVAEPNIGQAHYLTAYAPGASQIWLDMDGDTFQGWAPNIVTLSNAFQEAGVHHITATAMYPDGTQEVETTSIEVNNPERGTLYSENSNPVMYTLGSSTSSSSLENLPERITSDQAINYTIYKVNATIAANENVWYNSWLRDLTEEEDIDLPCYKKQQDPDVPADKLLGNSQKITISADTLTAGHTYELSVEVASSGYKYSYTF